MRLCFSIEYLLCVLFLAFTTAATQAQNWDWIRQSKGSSTEIGRTLATDTNGNVYVSGIFESRISLEGDTLQSAGSGDIFLCKYNQRGGLLWSRRAGGTGLDRVMDITIDSEANIILTGGFNGTIRFGQDSLQSIDRDIFICKYDSTGDVMWARSAGGGDSDFGESVTTDDQGNVYVTGSFNSDTLYIGTQSLIKTGTSDVFFAKYTHNGDFKWAIQGNASTSAIGKAIDTDLAGNVYATGYFQDTLTIGNTRLIGLDGHEIFMLKINPGGYLQWAKVIRGTGVDISQGILAATEHYFYLTGTFTQDINFEGNLLTSAGNFDLFLAKYTHNGDLVWTTRAGSSGPDNGWGLAQDERQNIYLTGGFRGNMALGSFTLNGMGNTDVFVAKYDVAGKALWATSAGGPGSDLGYDIAYGMDGNVFTTGNFSSNAQFDTTLLISTGREDMFLGRIIDEDTTDTPNAPYNTAIGQVFHDQNSDCNIDPDDRGLPQWILTATPGDWYTSTDASGKYRFELDSGRFAINQIVPADRLNLVTQICPLPFRHIALFDTLSQDTADLNFANELPACAYLTVDIASGVRQACQPNTTTVTYCNTGADTAFQVEVSVKLPKWTIPTGASHPFVLDAASNLVFSIGTLPPQSCGTLTLHDSVSCATTVVAGGHQGLEAWITPAFNCVSPSSNWSGASLEVTSDCMGGDTVIAKIINKGMAAMADSAQYRIFLDDTLAYRGNVKLISGGQLSISILAKGQTIRLEVDQEAFHPENTWVSTVTEGCCGAGTFPINTGFVTQFPNQDPLYPNAAFYNTTLSTIGTRQVFQQAVPSGRSQLHHIRSETRLSYTLQFHHTGTDTVTALVVRDTLSPHFDISTFRAGTASHPYTLEVTGKGRPVVSFIINTPAILPGESGFVSFSIQPKAGLAQGTQIQNWAEAWFNFAPPVSTQITFHTIQDSITLYPQPDRFLFCLPPDFADAGVDIDLCGTDTSGLDANFPTSGEGSWHLVTGSGTFDDNQDASTTVRSLGFGKNVFEWRITQCDSTTRDQVVIWRNALPIPPVISQLGDTLTTSGNGSFQWYDDQGSISGATGQVFSPGQSGTYTVIITDPNGCEVSSEAYAFIQTGIEENKLLSGTLFPNPTSGIFTVKWETTGVASLRLWDASGRLMESRDELRNGEVVFDLSGKPDGLYVVEVGSGGRYKRFKVVKGF